MHSFLVIRLIRQEECAGKLGVMWRIGIVLCLEAESFMTLETTILRSSVQKVSSVKLNSRLRCQHLHHAAASNVLDASGPAELSGGVGDDITMVVSPSRGLGVLKFLDLGSNGSRRIKVEGCASDF